MGLALLLVLGLVGGVVLRAALVLVDGLVDGLVGRVALGVMLVLVAVAAVAAMTAVAAVVVGMRGCCAEADDCKDEDGGGLHLDGYVCQKKR